jgi:prefoldin subunit 5
MPYQQHKVATTEKFSIVDRLKDRDVASRYYDELEAELQGVQAQPLSLDETCKKLEETIQGIATTPSATRETSK